MPRWGAENETFIATAVCNPTKKWNRQTTYRVLLTNFTRIAAICEKTRLVIATQFTYKL